MKRNIWIGLLTLGGLLLALTGSVGAQATPDTLNPTSNGDGFWT